MKLFLKILVPVTVLSLAAAGAYALVKSKPDPERRSAEEKSWVVEAETVLISDERPDLTLFGEVVAGRKVDMRPLIAGRIVAVGQNFVEGGIVRQGDLLVAIDPFDSAANVAERKVERDEARARLLEIQAERLLERMNTLDSRLDKINETKAARRIVRRAMRRAQ